MILQGRRMSVSDLRLGLIDYLDQLALRMTQGESFNLERNRTRAAALRGLANHLRDLPIEDPRLMSLASLECGPYGILDVADLDETLFDDPDAWLSRYADDCETRRGDRRPGE